MKVSVLLRTFNQRSFIAQAIESALMQRTDFDFEIVLGDDGSTDGTRAIVSDYATRYPDRIRAFLPEQNIGRRQMLVEGLDRARGEYVAILDGDDYWTDAGKLAAQVKCLEENPRASFCFHRAVIRYEADAREVQGYPHDRREYDADDIIARTCNIPTSAVLLRRLEPSFPPWLDDRFPFFDWPLWLYYALHGPALFIDEPMAVYRVHEGAFWSRGVNDVVGETEARRKLAERQRVGAVTFYELLRGVLPGRYHATISRALALQACELVWHYRQEKRWPEMRRYWWAAACCRCVPEGFDLGFLARTGLLALLDRVPFTRPILAGRA